MKTYLKSAKRYLDYYKKKLGLDHCQIDLIVADDEVVRSDANSEPSIVRTKDDAEVACREFAHKEYFILINRHTLKDGLKETILHELIHIIFFEYTSITESLIDIGGFSDDTRTRLWEQINMAEHGLVHQFMDLLK